jgi:hypothetical protein
MKSSFLIVADRGNMKAYRVEKVPAGRPPRVAMVQAFTFTDAHLRTSDKLTDQAGRFPVGSTPGQSQGRHQNAIAERTQLDLETDRRLIKEVADSIKTVLSSEQPEHWSFAAPSTIHEAVLSQLEPALRQKLAEQVTADLVNIEPSKLLGHFSLVAAA